MKECPPEIKSASAKLAWYESQRREEMEDEFIKKKLKETNEHMTVKGGDKIKALSMLVDTDKFLKLRHQAEQEMGVKQYAEEVCTFMGHKVRIIIDIDCRS